MTAVRTYLSVALSLAAAGVPVLPLRAGKVPFGNCCSCANNACGGRPNMKTPGLCACPRPCHGWAAATTDSAVLSSGLWVAAWKRAGAVAYHPAGAGVTVVDLDNADAVAWARESLPSTRTVSTTRGEHWIYRGTMRSANHVRPGADVKSSMAYARWLGPGTGTMTALPPAVLALVEREETTRPGEGVDSSSLTRARWDRSVATGCRHTDAYVRTGLERGLARILAHRETGAGSAAYGVARFLATQHTGCPGPCGLDAIGEQIADAAISVGVSAHYARRAVTNGFHGALGATA
ncbi:bifunctional DNA primase/polymerase [Streptomyces lateritius]|uniref:bifunctional DNA primase/polymerase n=1 Tax=Streptomyces lateritius TaxID=67313 RepID=UPI00167691ED|nr:bifunctional DNA primase/polymerase [Streptomyces lateritius]GGT99394.1 DNA primase [Streptomyces lateritius]